MISEETSGIVIENAEDCDNAGDYTTFNIAAGADVLRFTASDTDWSLSDGLEADLNFPFGVTLYHVFGNAKVGKAADSALVKIRSEYDYNTDYRETKPVSVGSTSVKWLYFGVLPVMAEAHYGKIKFEIKGNAIGAIVDIDNLVFAKIGSSVISTKYASNFASHWPDLNINHHTLSKRGGDVTVDMAGVDVNVTYKGSSPTIYTKNDVIYGMWLAADGGFWIPNVLRNNVLTATRTTTFLIPQ
ncbi:MAG: hypothetical protein GY943_00935 [Chloroflexi bacterium]|nr:hypothetical protein [Chloroflexota bacterium]